MAAGFPSRSRFYCVVAAGLYALLSFPGSVYAQGGEPLNVVTATRIVGDETRTRFIADLTDEIPINVFTLADPYRIIIDLPEVHFQLDAGTGEDGFALISAYRFGLISRGQSRIVLDLTEPVEVANQYVLAPVGDEPARLVVDLVTTTREAFLAGAVDARPTPPQNPAGSPPLGDNYGDGRLVVVIDPGHGGIDAGAISANGVMEKDVVLAFSLELAEQLRATGDYVVLMTRETDIYPSNSSRVEFARESAADIFISIHADSYHDASVRGLGVYTVSDRASNQVVAELVARENRADAMAGLHIPEETGDDVFDILVDLTRRETKNFSVILAREIVAALRGSTPLRPNPEREGGFVQLKAPDVPSVLVELGFLTNAQDEANLQSASWRRETAGHMVDAIGTFFEARVVGFGL